MKITLDTLTKATRQLALENKKSDELDTELPEEVKAFFADDIGLDDDEVLNTEKEPEDGKNAEDEPKDAEPEDKDDAEGDTAADALADLKDAALDDTDKDAEIADAPDLDDEDTVLDLSVGKKEDDEDKDGDEKGEDDSEKDDKEDEEPKDEEKEQTDESTEGFWKELDNDTNTYDVDGEQVSAKELVDMIYDCIHSFEDEFDFDQEAIDKCAKDVYGEYASSENQEDLDIVVSVRDWISANGVGEREAADECNKAEHDAILVNEDEDEDEEDEDEDEDEDEGELNRYEMGWSQAEHAWMVVYAHDMREAEGKFEDGEFELEEPDEDEECKKVKVHVYNIEWDTDDGAEHWDDDQPLDVSDDEEHWDDDQIEKSDPPTEVDLEVEVCPGDDLNDVIGDALSDEYEFLVKGFNFDVVEDDGEVDESALGDAFKSIGQGIKDLLKTTLKGAAVLIAGLGGSFLFGLPGLLLAVCIAFGLMSAKESAKGVEVDEGLLGGVKDKLKTVIGVLKADPKKSKELNDKMLAAKKAGDKDAMKKIAGEVKSLAGNGGKTPPDGGNKDEVEIDEDGDCCECDVAERHGEFKRSKFKKDKWGDGRRGRPNRREEDEIDPLDLDLIDDEDFATSDVDIVDDEDDDYSEVAENEDDFKDGPAKALKSIGIEDPEKASEEDLEAAKALLGIEVTEDEDVCKDGKCGCGADGCKECGTKDVSTVAEMRTFLRECSTFKKNPRLRKAVSKFTRMMAESPRKAQALVDQLDHRFKGKPVTERRFCETFVKSI